MISGRMVVPEPHSLRLPLPELPLTDASMSDYGKKKS